MMVPLYSTIGSLPLVLVELVRSEVGGQISHAKGQPLRTNQFLSWSVSGLSSAVEPPDAPMDATVYTIQPYVNDVNRFVFRAVSHQVGNVLITE